ncbi:MAG: SDR family oxidoreductase [Thermoanaerobaculales bacterium]|nr:SDR family oxidoreductase [Thermoanaerobaculales bacterium]
MKVLVTGATGYVGGLLVPLLLERGHRVRVMVRDPERVAGRPWSPQVEIVRADVEQPATLAAALDGMEAAYYLVHLMGGGGDFAERDRRAAAGFVANAGHLRHVIYLGGLLPEAVKVSKHLASRAEVGEILRAGLPTTEFRAGPVIGAGSASFEMVRYLTERLPAMIAPKWILNQVQPVAVRDILDYLLLSLDRGPSGLYNVGAAPLSFKGMMQEFAAVRGLKRVIVPVPVLAPGLAALWVGLVTPISNRLAVPLIEGVVHPVVADTSRARADFPEVVPLPYRDAVAVALRQTEDHEVATRWSDALGSAPAFELRQSEGLIRETRSCRTGASPEAVFRAFSSLGGDTGWPFWNWAWSLRGTIDQLVGGPGLRRGRRHPTELEPGDALDFWRVERVEPPHLLRLRAEMKVPGRAWLQWEAVPEDGGTQLVQTAVFEPIGLGGQMYWNLSYPIHKVMFSGMVRRLAARAEREAR